MDSHHQLRQTTPHSHAQDARAPSWKLSTQHSKLKTQHLIRYVDHLRLRRSMELRPSPSRAAEEGSGRTVSSI